jgi:hypothetical protein
VARNRYDHFVAGVTSRRLCEVGSNVQDLMRQEAGFEVMATVKCNHDSQPLAGIKSLRATLPDEIFTGDFASRTVHFVNICVKTQQMRQLVIQFINYVW